MGWDFVVLCANFSRKSLHIYHEAQAFGSQNGHSKWGIYLIAVFISLSQSPFTASQLDPPVLDFQGLFPEKNLYQH